MESKMFLRAKSAPIIENSLRMRVTAKATRTQRKRLLYGIEMAERGESKKEERGQKHGDRWRRRAV